MCSRHSTMYWGERHRLNKLPIGDSCIGYSLQNKNPYL